MPRAPRPPLRLTLLAVAWLLLLSAPAAAHHPGGLGDPHEDPRSMLPDSLVTAPVAQAEVAAVAPAALATDGPSLPETWCGTESTGNVTATQTVAAATPHFKLVYAHARDRPNRFGDLPARDDDNFDDRLQATVSLLGRYMATQSGGRKALRWDMGTSCPESPGRYVDIQVVHLPQDLAFYNDDTSRRFDRLEADVRAVVDAGMDRRPRNLMIYADGFYKTGPGGRGVAGQGSLYSAAETPDADSRTFGGHDAGGLTGFVYGPVNPPTNGLAWPSPMLHEASHNLGAVQLSAPHTSGAGHCDDRFDVMCYPDGGSSYVETTPCERVAGAVDETFDCGHDDYFDPDPAPGSYLATHRNVYDAAHLAPCAESFEACGIAPPADTTAPENTTPAAGAAWRTAAYTVRLDGTDAESTVDAWQWRIGAGPVQETRDASIAGDGVHPFATRVRDAAGNWSDWRAETVRIDGMDPSADVACTPIGSGRHRCVPSAADEHSGLADLTLLRDGARAGAVAPGTPFETGGPAEVALVATDGVGRTATSSAVRLAGPAAAPSIGPVPSGVLRASGRAVMRAGARRLGTGLLELRVADGGHRVSGELRLGRLARGTWRLQACVRPGRCVRRTITLRRAGRPPVLRLTGSAPAGAVRATFTLARKVRGRFRAYGTGATSAKLG